MRVDPCGRIRPHGWARSARNGRDLEVPPLVVEGAAQAPAEAVDLQPPGAGLRSDVDGMTPDMRRLRRWQHPPASLRRTAVGGDRLVPQLLLPGGVRAPEVMCRGTPSARAAADACAYAVPRTGSRPPAPSSACACGAAIDHATIIAAAIITRTIVRRVFPGVRRARVTTPVKRVLTMASMTQGRRYSVTGCSAPLLQ